MAMRSPTGPFVGIGLLFHLILTGHPHFRTSGTCVRVVSSACANAGSMMFMATTSIRALTRRSAPAGPLSAPRLSISTLPDAVSVQQAGNRLLGFCQFVLAAPQGGLQAGQLRVQILTPGGVRVLADVGASCGPYVDQALSREQPDSGLGCVLGDVMQIPELPVRRHAATWRIGPVPDLGLEGIREAPTREAVGAWRGHSASIADCLKTALDVPALLNYCLKSEEIWLKTPVHRPGFGAAHDSEGVA